MGGGRRTANVETGTGGLVGLLAWDGWLELPVETEGVELAPDPRPEKSEL